MFDKMVFDPSLSKSISWLNFILVARKRALQKNVLTRAIFELYVHYMTNGSSFPYAAIRKVSIQGQLQ